MHMVDLSTGERTRVYSFVNNSLNAIPMFAHKSDFEVSQIILIITTILKELRMTSPPLVIGEVFFRACRISNDLLSDNLLSCILKVQYYFLLYLNGHCTIIFQLQTEANKTSRGFFC